MCKVIDSGCKIVGGGASSQKNDVAEQLESQLQLSPQYMHPCEFAMLFVGKQSCLYFSLLRLKLKFENAKSVTANRWLTLRADLRMRMVPGGCG